MREGKDTAEFGAYFQAAFAKRPPEELYDIARGPSQMSNTAESDALATVKGALSARLDERLLSTSDPRALGQPPDWESNPHYGRLTLEQRR